LAKELGVEDRVIFVGHADSVELAAAYTRSNVVVLPSIVEGFGLVIIEAWLYGKPVVVSNRAGVAELISHGRNGFLVDPDNTEELAESIKSILKRDALAEELANNGKVTAELCSVDSGVEAELRLFREITGGVP
jgi:glycosyltransferase involved in cell wall biosynthesis